MTSEMQELHCHECKKYCRFPTDETKNGNITVVCRNCEHEHHRYVVNGQVTGDRWKPSGGNKQHKAPRRIRAEIAEKDALSHQKGVQKSQFLRQSWANSTTGN